MKSWKKKKNKHIWATDFIFTLKGVGIKKKKNKFGIHQLLRASNSIFIRIVLSDVVYIRDTMPCLFIWKF